MLEQLRPDKLLPSDDTSPQRFEHGTPSFAWLAGRTPQQVMADLGAQGVCVWAGDYDAVELMRSLGLADSGGAVRAGVVCYTTAQEVDRLLACL